MSQASPDDPHTPFPFRFRFRLPDDLWLAQLFAPFIELDGEFELVYLFFGCPSWVLTVKYNIFVFVFYF